MAWYVPPCKFHFRALFLILSLPKIVVYTVSTEVNFKSFVLHGQQELAIYQDDEADLQNTQPGNSPIVANHSVRRHLLAAKTGPPGELDLEKVADVVQRSLGKKGREGADVTVRTWFCLVCSSRHHAPSLKCLI